MTEKRPASCRPFPFYEDRAREHRLELGRQRALRLDALAVGAFEREPRGVQELAAQAGEARRGAAVERVACDRVAEVREVRPDLVHHAGDDPDAQACASKRRATSQCVSAGQGRSPFARSRSSVSGSGWNARPPRCASGTDETPPDATRPRRARGRPSPPRAPRSGRAARPTPPDRARTRRSRSSPRRGAEPLRPREDRARRPRTRGSARRPRSRACRPLRARAGGLPRPPACPPRRGAAPPRAPRASVGLRLGRAGRLLHVDCHERARLHRVARPGATPPHADLAELERALHRGAPEPERVRERAIEPPRGGERQPNLPSHAIHSPRGARPEGSLLPARRRGRADHDPRECWRAPSGREIERFAWRTQPASAPFRCHSPDAAPGAAPAADRADRMPTSLTLPLDEETVRSLHVATQCSSADG